jgi:hypothetical protein
VVVDGGVETVEMLETCGGFWAGHFGWGGMFGLIDLS